MNYILTIFIFITILFLYIHIADQYKTSEDLEIYEMDYINNKQFQDVCNIKQPVLFEFKSIEPTAFRAMTISTIENATKYDINIFDSRDYWKTLDTVDSITMPFVAARKLIGTDTNSHFFTEHNETFMDENGFSKKLNILNTYFKPYGTVQTKYDILYGSTGTCTPLRYHTDYRHILMVSSGKIHVKMAPWGSSQYLEPIKDYEKYEFKSPINVWNPQQKYLQEIGKIKFLEFDVFADYAFYIPPYWWYSIKYTSEDQTSAFTCTYNTIMNCIANIPDIGLYWLQQQNITKKITKMIPAPTGRDEVKPDNNIIRDESNKQDATIQIQSMLTDTVATTSIDSLPIYSLPIDSLPVDDQINNDDKTIQNTVANSTL